MSTRPRKTCARNTPRKKDGRRPSLAMYAVFRRSVDAEWLLLGRPLSPSIGLRSRNSSESALRHAIRQILLGQPRASLFPLLPLLGDLPAGAYSAEDARSARQA